MNDVKYLPMESAPVDGTQIIGRFTEECGHGSRKVQWRKDWAGPGWYSIESPVNQMILEDCFDGWATAD